MAYDVERGGNPKFQLDGNGVMRDDYKLANRTFYDLVAPEYAEKRAWTPDTKNSIWLNLTCEVGPYIKEGDKVLFIGVGTGSDKDSLEKYCKTNNIENVTFVGVDLSLAMLREADMRSDDHLSQAEAKWLPFPERSFDFVYCESAPEHWDPEYLQSTFTEIKRIVNIDYSRRAQVLLSVRQGDDQVLVVDEDLTELHDNLASSLKVWSMAMFEFAKKGNFSLIRLPFHLNKYFYTYTHSLFERITLSSGFEIVKLWASKGGTPSIIEKSHWQHHLLSVS